MLRTKWDILEDRANRAHEEYLKLMGELEGLEKTQFRTGEQRCRSCGAKLRTEADFAKHYLVPEERYSNIGFCPNRYNDGVKMPHGLLEAWEIAILMNDQHDIAARRTKALANPHGV